MSNPESSQRNPVQEISEGSNKKAQKVQENTKKKSQGKTGVKMMKKQVVVIECWVYWFIISS